MEKLRFEGKKEDILLKSALETLNLSENEIYYSLKEEKAGLLKGKKYILEVVKISDVQELGKELIKNLLKGLNVEGNIESKIREKTITYSIHSENNSIIIGKNGHILEAIQLFVRQAIYARLDIFVNITIDVENYKQKQNYFLEKKVKKLAREVTLTKADIKLDPMNSYERKLIHDALSGFKYVETKSEGEEPNRYVVIKYKDAKNK